MNTLKDIIDQINSNSVSGTLTPAVTFEDDPEIKIYLILLSVYEEEGIIDGTSKDWKIKIGRQDTYDWLKDMVRSEVIDPNESFIISGNSIKDEFTDKDNITFNSKPITVYRFLKIMYENKKVLDDSEIFEFESWDPKEIYQEESDKTIFEI